MLRRVGALSGRVRRWLPNIGVADSFIKTKGYFEVLDAPYAIVATDRVQPAGSKAVLVSDPIPCQVGPGEMRFRYEYPENNLMEHLLVQVLVKPGSENHRLHQTIGEIISGFRLLQSAD